MARSLLTDEILADLMPGLTSSTLVSFRPSDLRRGGSPEAAAAAAIAAAQEMLAEQQLSASAEERTHRIVRSRAQVEEPTPITGEAVVPPKRKPTDSFTLHPEFAQRVYHSTAIELIDPTTGDHVAFVRGIVHRDPSQRITKIQCYLPRGRYLCPPGTRVDCRIEGVRWRVRDGFYVTPRDSRKDEWMYLAYIST